MTASKSSLKDRLVRYRQIKLSVIGRNLGRGIAIPLRFLSPMTSSIFDQGAARYWQGLPLYRMTGVLLAFFFTFSGFAFLLDLFNWQGLPLWALLVSAPMIGANSVAFFVILSRRHFQASSTTCCVSSGCDLRAGATAAWFPNRCDRCRP